MKVGVVTAYVPLPVKHLTEKQYRDYGDRLQAAVEDAEGVTLARFTATLPACWAMDICTGLPPANPVPADRYDTPEINVMSHIVQHNRTTFARHAAEDFPQVDVWVWLDLAILKQGHWNNKPVTEEAITRFLRKIAALDKLDDIPFPGITERQTVYPTGNVWRFCGSTHIWPTKFLPAIDEAYRSELCRWIANLNTVPLDLPIWALVEQKHPELPFRWYQAEYDVTQFDNFPGA